MARRKKPENESSDETRIRRALETVADKATRNEKVSWERKLDNMIQLVASVRPLEDQISDLIVKKQPIMDDIQKLRADMVSDCVHPYTHLTHHTDSVMGEYIECKFCFKRFSMPKQ